MAKITVKLPKTLALCADRLYELKSLKSAANKAVELLEDEEKAIKAHLILTLPKGEASGIQGKLARVSIYTVNKPQVENWDLLHAYIKKTGAWDLLQKRIGEAAVNERWDNKKVVPGVIAFAVTQVSMNKV